MESTETAAESNLNETNEIEEPEIPKSEDIEQHQIDDTNLENPNETEVENREPADSTANEPDENLDQNNEETPIENTDKNTIYKLSEGYFSESKFWQLKREIYFVEEIPTGFLCECCHFILWKPLKLECDHVICHSCRTKVNESESNVSFDCPIDGNTLKMDQTENLESEQAMIRETLVYCFEPKCLWKGQLLEIEQHQKTCDYKLTICHYCKEQFFDKEIKNHMENLCNNREVKCPHCEISIIWSDEEFHDKICQEKFIPCSNECTDKDDKTKINFFKQKDMASHLENECIERKVSCMFDCFNCPKICKYKRMYAHVVKYSIIHLNDMVSNSKCNTDVLTNQVRELLDLENRIKMNEQRLTKLNIIFGPQLLWKITEIQEKYDRALSGQVEEIMSRPFFTTDPYGYKFVARFVLNIHHANIANHYVAIYISICDSPYNALLSWPYKQKFQIHLINLKSNKHISHTLTPNTAKENYPFIQKPITERNPYFGIDKFARCNVLLQDSCFVEDNSIFIKITIEPHDI